MKYNYHQKKGRGDDFKVDAEQSRVFKSQYSAVMARRLIEAGVRRTVVNMTISHANFDQIEAIYAQAVALQEYATSIGSKTEVLFTFSPWVWRAHQARGDNPGKHSPEDALRMDDMPRVNAALSRILDDTYARVDEGRPRILANSSGYTSLHAEPAFRKEAVRQDVPYRRGLPLMFGVQPNAEIRLDPMFAGPELQVVRSTFGYMDRDPDPSKNPFSDFQHGNRAYLPNLISSENLSDPEVQPQKIMDRRLARMIVQRVAMEYYSTNAGLMNKSDSPHAMGNPRVLGSDPHDVRYLAERLVHTIRTEIDEDHIVLAGIASFGLGLAAVTSLVSLEDGGKPLPNVYVKLAEEGWKGKRQVEGVIDTTRLPVIVDDLIFHSTTTRGAVNILRQHGYPAVTDTIHVIDRQLQQTGNPDKPNLQEFGIKDHNLITMQEIVSYGVENGLITPKMLDDLINSYLLYPRLDLPDFANVPLDSDRLAKVEKLRAVMAGNTEK